MAVFSTDMTPEQFQAARLAQLQWDLAENKGRLAFYESEVERLERALKNFLGSHQTMRDPDDDKWICARCKIVVPIGERCRHCGKTERERQ